MSRRTFLSSTIFLPLILSCAGNLPQRYPVTISEYDHVIGEHTVLSRGIITDRRVFDFQFRHGVYSSRGEGVFLYRRPGMMRVDLYVGTAELIFQYFRREDRSLVFFPREGRVIEGRDGLIILDGIEGLEGMSLREEELSAAMLCLYDLSGKIEEFVEVREGNDGYLLCLAGRGETRYVQLDSGTYALEGYTVMAADRKLREIHFSSYAGIDGIPRPGTVTYKDHDKGFEIELWTRTERINEAIDAGLFDPPF